MLFYVTFWTRSLSGSRGVFAATDTQSLGFVHSAEGSRSLPIGFLSLGAYTFTHMTPPTISMYQKATYVK